jgi:hypothetical protein
MKKLTLLKKSQCTPSKSPKHSFRLFGYDTGLPQIGTWILHTGPWWLNLYWNSISFFDVEALSLFILFLAIIFNIQSLMIHASVFRKWIQWLLFFVYIMWLLIMNHLWSLWLFWTPLNRILEMLKCAQLVMTSSNFHGMWKSITTFTISSNQSLSWARWIQSTPSNTISLNTILY